MCAGLRGKVCSIFWWASGPVPPQPGIGGAREAVWGQMGRGFMFAGVGAVSWVGEWVP